jgi:WD40 repeat protein
MVATASLDGTARVWETSTGEPIATLTHDDVVDTVSFSPDGQRLATASRDGTARVWEASTGEPIATLTHDAEVDTVSFSPDGQRVATASRDGTARIRWVWSQDLAEQICQRHYRNFTATEWRNYVQQDLGQYRLTCPNLPVHPTVIAAAYAIARDGNLRQSTALLRHLLKISLVAGHDIDLDLATEELDQNPRAVARKYSAVHLVREATTLARNGEVSRATRIFQQALDRDPDIDLDPSTDTLDQDPAAIAHTLANPAEQGPIP